MTNFIELMHIRRNEKYKPTPRHELIYTFFNLSSIKLIRPLDSDSSAHLYMAARGAPDIMHHPQWQNTDLFKAFNTPKVGETNNYDDTGCVTEVILNCGLCFYIPYCYPNVIGKIMPDTDCEGRYTNMCWELKIPNDMQEQYKVCECGEENSIFDTCPNELENLKATHETLQTAFSDLKREYVGFQEKVGDEYNQRYWRTREALYVAVKTEKALGENDIPRLIDKLILNFGLNRPTL